MTELKECPTCSMKFRAKRFWQRFCCRACKISYEQHERKEALKAYRGSEKPFDTSDA